MINRTLFIIVCFTAFTFVLFSGAGLTPGTAAFASGGGGGGRDVQIESSNEETKGQKSKDKQVRGSLRAVELNLDMLDKEAKRNNLRGLGTSSRRISSLRLSIDTAYDELDGTKHRNEPNKIYEKLRDFANQKDNRELAFFARNILRAIAADRQLHRALEAADRYNKAIKAGKTVEAIDHQIEYEDARSEYHRQGRKIPKKLRDRLFDPLPKNVPKF